MYHHGGSNYKPQIDEGLKLSKPQVEVYTRLFRDAISHHKPGKDVSLIGVSNQRKITLAKLIERGLIVETVTEQTETYTSYDLTVHHDVERERTYTTTTHHIAAIDELERIIKDDAHTFALEVVAARIERERMFELADARKQEVCQRFMISADEVQVTAKTEYIYDDTPRKEQKFVNYQFELGVMVDSTPRHGGESVKYYKSFASVNTSWNGDTPEIGWHSTIADAEYALTMARSIHMAAQIVEAGLWK